jgi:hypothetical protein
MKTSKREERACKIPKTKNCSKKEVTGDFVLSTVAYKMDMLQRVLDVQWGFRENYRKK